MAGPRATYTPRTMSDPEGSSIKRRYGVPRVYLTGATCLVTPLLTGDDDVARHLIYKKLEVYLRVFLFKIPSNLGTLCISILLI